MRHGRGRARAAWVWGAGVLAWCAIASAQDTPAGAGSSAGAGRGGSVSLFEAFFIQRHPMTKEIELLGSLIIWVLLVLSVVCLGLLGAMTLDNRRRNIVPDGLVSETEALLARRDFKGALARVASEPSDFGRVLHAGLTESVHGYAAMVRAVEQVSEELMLRRLRRIEPLNVIGNVAPMIGLFGTVYGMILAFREIVAAGGTPDPVGLAAGIGTALTTTFWGLIVAIPALAGYALLRNAIDGHAVAGARAAEAMLGRFRADPKADPKPRAGAGVASVALAEGSEG